MPPLLVALTAILPIVCQLPPWAILPCTVTASAIIWAATGKTIYRILLTGLFLFALVRSALILNGGPDAYWKHIPRNLCRISAILDVPGNPTPPTSRGTSHPMAVKAIKAYGAWHPCDGIVLTRFPPETTLTHGETYLIQGTLSPIPENGYGRHLLSQDIRYFLSVSKISMRQSPSGSALLYARFLNLRHDFGKLLVQGMSNSSGNLYQSMLLGRRDLFPQETKLHFLRSATLHIFAISGLHVNIINLTILRILQGLGLGRILRLLIGCCCCLTYILLTGATPSSLRSGIMMVLFIVPECLHRPANGRHSICLAALVELLCNPLVLFHSGFLFSFVIVAALIYSGPLLSYLKCLTLEPWNWLPTCKQKYRALKLPNALWKTCGPLAVAWMASLPISLYLNGMVSLGGLAVGLPAQLLAWILVVAAIPKLVLAVLCPPLANLLGRFMDITMQALVKLAEYGGQQSLCLMGPRSQGVMTAIPILALFILLGHGWRLPPIRFISGLTVLTFMLMAIRPPYDPPLTVAVAQGPTGQTPAVCILHGKQKKTQIIQTGHLDSTRLLLRKLADNGWNTVHELVLMDLNGNLQGQQKLGQKQDLRHLILATSADRPFPVNLKQETARGIYLTKQPTDSKSIRNVKFPSQNLQAVRDANGIKTTYRDRQLTLVLAQAPDGQFWLLAQTPHDARTLLLSPNPKGTFFTFPITP